MFTRKPRLQLEKFAINGAKRLFRTQSANGDEVRRSACGRQSRDRVEGVEWPTLDPLRTSAVGIVKRLSVHPVWSG